MTMHIVFKRDKDGYKEGWAGYVERTLARRFCDERIAIPYKTYLENIRVAEKHVKEKQHEKEMQPEKEKNNVDDVKEEKGSSPKKQAKKSKK